MKNSSFLSLVALLLSLITIRYTCCNSEPSTKTLIAFPTQYNSGLTIEEVPLKGDTNGVTKIKYVAFDQVIQIDKELPEEYYTHVLAHEYGHVFSNYLILANSSLSENQCVQELTAEAFAHLTYLYNGEGSHVLANLNLSDRHEVRDLKDNISYCVELAIEWLKEGHRQNKYQESEITETNILLTEELLFSIFISFKDSQFLKKALYQIENNTKQSL